MVRNVFSQNLLGDFQSNFIAIHIRFIWTEKSITNSHERYLHKGSILCTIFTICCQAKAVLDVTERHQNTCRGKIDVDI